MTYKPIQVLVYDPTKTLTLRSAFVRDMNRRFKALTAVIKEAVVKQDCFGLSVQTYAELNPPYSQAFAFPSVEEKVQAFMVWLALQEDRGILETFHTFRGSGMIEEPWTSLYTTGAYERGVLRSRQELKKSGYDVPTDEIAGGIAAIMALPSHVDQLGLVNTRTFAELQGVASQMETKVAQVIAQGLVDGDSATVLARKITAAINGSGLGELGITDSLGRFIPAQVRARTIARTEIVRAHHRANIEEYRNWQVLGVKVMAEFSTAGDERVCTECAGYHGNIYTLKEVEFMIPVHPNCRCIALPVANVKLI